MNFIVCVKQAPDSESRLQTLDDHVNLDSQVAPGVINPLDEYALEAAVQLKAQKGGSVLALMLGQEDDLPLLKHCLAAGADEAVLLVRDGQGWISARQTALALASEISSHPFDIIFCGRQSYDGQNAQTGNLIAARLGLPCITAVTTLSIDNQELLAERDLDGVSETIECQLPCVLTVEKGINKPRYPSLREILQARQKPLIVKPVNLTRSCFKPQQLVFPETQRRNQILGQGPEAVPAIVKIIRTALN